MLNWLLLCILYILIAIIKNNSYLCIPYKRVGVGLSIANEMSL